MKHKLFPIFLAAFAFCSTNASASRYYFWESGFGGGGTLSGYFDAIDANSDGHILGGPLGMPNNEVATFSMSITGNAKFADFSSSMLDLVGLDYNINLGPFLGDNTAQTPVNLIEGLAVSHTLADSSLLCYSAGYTAFNNGAGIYLNNNLTDIVDSSPLPVVVSLSPITQQTYDAAVQTIPEPDVCALVFLGALPFLRHIRRARACPAH